MVQENVRVGGLGRLFFGVALTTLIGFVLYVGRGVLIPLTVAGFLSFLIVALKTGIQRIPVVGRFVPNWLGFVPAFLVIAGMVILFEEIVRSNIEALLASSDAYVARLRELSTATLEWLKSHGALPEDFVLGVDQIRSEALKLIRPALSQTAGAARTLAGNTVTIFLYTAFIVAERGAMMRKIGLLATEGADRGALNETIGDIGELIRRYLTIKTLTGLIVAGMSLVVMLALGVDFAGFWALLILVLNFIPIIGAITGITAPVLLMLVQPEGGGLTQAAILLALLVACEQTVSSFIEPRLMGKSLNLSPLVILLSLAAWGTLWGFAGMLLCVPITVAVMLGLSQFHTTRPVAILLSQTGQIEPVKRERLPKDAETPKATDEDDTSPPAA